MKKTTIFSLLAATLTLAFVACNSDGTSTSSTDSTSSSTTDVTTTNTSTGNYAAQADSFKINSEKGYYLNARTGKPIKIKVDASTGARINEETGEPVGYYVDNRTWWVYSDESWDTVGEAHMQGDELHFKDDGDKWVTYDQKWKIEDNGKMKTKIEKDGDVKQKTDDGVKVKSEGDETKIKDKQ